MGCCGSIDKKTSTLDVMKPIATNKDAEGISSSGNLHKSPTTDNLHDKQAKVIGMTQKNHVFLTLEPLEKNSLFMRRKSKDITKETINSINELLK